MTDLLLETKRNANKLAYCECGYKSQLGGPIA